MSNNYWKNLVDKSIGDSEILKEYQIISNKIDFYYKNYSLKADLASLVKYTETPPKILTVSGKIKSGSRNYENKTPELQTKHELMLEKLRKSPHHRRMNTMKERTFTLRKKSRQIVHQKTLT